MSGMFGTNLTSSISADTDFSAPDNGTDFFGKIYVFRPINPSIKLALLLSLVVIGIIAFGGNVLILIFLKTKERANSFVKTCSFLMNFNFYIKSLAISDVLSSVISLPYMGLQLYLDVMQRGWGCKIGRYLLLLFPCVTINNLLVISFGKYFATRQAPRTFSHSTVKRIVLFAWLAAILFVLLPAATYEGIRYDLNSTHYTVICMYDREYLPFRIMFVSAAILQYIIPSCILIKLNISLIIIVWKTTRRTIDVQRDNGIRSMVRAARVRSIYTVVALTFAFVTPYILYVSYVIYHMVAQPKMDFETDHVIRTSSVIMALSNSAINVIIYLVRMKDFRTFLREMFIFRFFTHKATIPEGVVGVEMQPRQT
ncbi:putative G-protein coupled receptor 19 [Oculina patagonica]